MLDDQALMQALNSTPVVDGRRQDLWRDDQELDRWAREHGGFGGEEERRWLRTARDALQAMESGEPDGPDGPGEPGQPDALGTPGAAAVADAASGPDAAAEAGLRRVLAGVHRVPRPSGSGIEWHLEAPAERGLAVELVLAWADVKERLPGRLRPCGNPECRLFLLDRSRANTARWCSMKTCGNRLKARRHQARTREISGPGTE
ncbi:CGNR zinc finger domain-containing protein [Streptomyces sp. LRE541]|uniref:CGNR zinc finger domain-containing protein n=1 Tax=Streptomyces sp. LRE541 TaxID=2931983 RepID=UPI00200C2E00|nr:CGNR zinc finger domain-containing protein [Streptomyces sp. LRE541]UPZ26928.1 CGNR zinc finger domain-containing protein [Streptomyces sp. LRE541]